MLLVPKPHRQPSTRHPFRAPLWDDNHPAFRRIDATLPRDHHARWLVTVVSRLDLTACRLGYAGYGSLAYPVELLLAFVLFLYSKGILSPAEWARQAHYDDQCKWLLRGLQPSRSQLYLFRDRVEPSLDDWHQQLIAWAIDDGITSASRGSRRAIRIRLRRLQKYRPHIARRIQHPRLAQQLNRIRLEHRSPLPEPRVSRI